MTLSFMLSQSASYRRRQTSLFCVLCFCFGFCVVSQYEERCSDGMTTPNLYDEKEVMEEFISCYQHFTALWDNSSMDYLSKKKKEPGYQELLKILKRVNRDASVQDVKRKINSLRCCYRREIKKIQLSYGSYEPRLWWFHMMDFLKPVLHLDQTMMTSTSTSSATATPISKSTVTTPSRVKQESRRSLDDSLDEASMHVSMTEESAKREREKESEHIGRVNSIRSVSLRESESAGLLA